jgi:hypothetical protein
MEEIIMSMTTNYETLTLSSRHASQPINIERIPKAENSQQTPSANSPNVDTFETIIPHVSFVNFDKNFYHESYTVESATARYAELREEIHQLYGNNSGLLEYNLNMLDRVFERRMEDIATSAAKRLKNENSGNSFLSMPDGTSIRLDNLSPERAEEVREILKNLGFKNPDSILRNANSRNYEFNKIATNAAFNANQFTNNTKNLMSQFVSSFLQHMRADDSYNSAYKNATDFMNSTTKTTSVNNLSFHDFMIYEKMIASVQGITKPTAMLTAWGEANNTFNNSTEISAELRALLK